MPITFISVLRAGFYKIIKQKGWNLTKGYLVNLQRKIQRMISFNGGDMYSW